MKKIRVLLLLPVFFFTWAHAQTLFVDPVKGQSNAAGDSDHPVTTISEAVRLTRNFSGNDPITIKLYPGLYLLKDQVELDSFANGNNIQLLSIEAVTLPDDTAWSPAKMPVIQSVSPNNKNWKAFDHCAGFQVQRDHVAFRGLKFVGNSNPSVVYYYAIERHFPELEGLEISQCLFVGNRNAAPIQGALFVQGPRIRIDHCIFYECKNAVLAFINVTGFSLTHSIVYGSYEGAIWFGKFSDVNFHSNIIAHNKCFWVSMKDYTSRYRFDNSVITANDMFMGLNHDGVIEKDHQTKPELRQVQLSGRVELQMVTTDTIPKNYLHPVKNSAGTQLRAGLFK